MSTSRRLSVVGAIAAVFAVGACTGSGESGGASPDSQSAVVLDVRTVEEYAAGHLDGAVNLDVQSPEFADEIEALDPAVEYVVYCRSGNRSAQAVATMTELGFADVSDAGGIDSASTETGLDIVTGQTP